MGKRNTTRGAQGAGTIRKKTVTKNGKTYEYFEGRVTTGFDKCTGRQIQKSITGKTQKQVLEKMQALMVEINHGTYLEPSKMTLAQFLDIWLSDYMGDKRYMTKRTYEDNVECHIKPQLGAVKLSQLRPHMIQKFYNGLMVNGKKILRKDKDGKIIKKDDKIVYDSAPLSAKTVRNIHGTLTKALSTAVSIGYLRENPADRVTLPRVEKKELAPLTDQQVKDFLQAAKGDELEILMKVILFTGMRESEALGLTWNSVDFKKSTVKISKQLQKRKLEDGGSTLAPTKNGKTRVLKVAPTVLALLERQKVEQTEQRLKAGELWQGWQDVNERETALVFTTAEGNHISQTSLRYHFKKVVEAIGVPDCRVHDLRHTFAVLSLQEGIDLKTVQDALGHATAAFTLDVYGHVSEKMKEDGAAKIEAYIQDISNL